MKVRLIDIARAAGVSRSAVSKALNDAPDISPKRTAEIKAIAQRMGYRPNRAAKLAGAKRTHTIGVLCHDPMLPSVVECFMSMIQEIESLGYHAMVDISPLDELSRTIERAHELLDHRVEGLLINPVIDCVAQVESLRQRCKYIIACTAKGYFSTPVVSVDLIRAGSQAVEHLYELGHRDWILVSGSSRQTAMFDKYAGILQASASRGIPFGENRVIRCEDKSESAYRAFLEYLSDNPAPRAIISETHPVFRGVFQACVQKGLRIPEDVSIVDGEIGPFDTDYSGFRPTWIHVKPTEVGRTAVNKLVDWLEKTERGQPDYVPEDSIIEPELILGDSTAAPAKQPSGVSR